MGHIQTKFKNCEIICKQLIFFHRICFIFREGRDIGTYCKDPSLNLSDYISTLVCNFGTLIAYIFDTLVLALGPRPTKLVYLFSGQVSNCPLLFKILHKHLSDN